MLFVNIQESIEIVVYGQNAIELHVLSVRNSYEIRELSSPFTEFKPSCFGKQTQTTAMLAES